MNDPFAMLGVPRSYSVDRGELDARYRELQKALHPDRYASASASERRMSLSRAVEVNEAYRALKDDVRRAEALLSLYKRDRGAEAAEPAADPDADPEFLMQVMELREQLGEAKAARDLPRVSALAEQVRGLQREAVAQLDAAFSSLEGGTQLASGPCDAHLQALADAAAALGRVKYFRRFLDEVSVIEEEALS